METMSPNINELAAALAKAQAEMRPAEETGFNPHFKSFFSTLGDVIDASRAALAKHGLAMVQLPTTDDAGKTVLRSVLMHSSGQWISATYPINPVKQDPQGMGSALSYARRYSYSPMVGVVAKGEDDDGEQAMRGNSKPPAIGAKKPLAIAGATAQPVTEREIPIEEWTVDFASSLQGRRLLDLSTEELSDAANTTLKRFEASKKPIEGKIGVFLKRAQHILAMRTEVQHA